MNHKYEIIKKKVEINRHKDYLGDITHSPTGANCDGSYY